MSDKAEKLRDGSRRTESGRLTHLPAGLDSTTSTHPRISLGSTLHEKSSDRVPIANSGPINFNPGFDKERGHVTDDDDKASQSDKASRKSTSSSRKDKKKSDDSSDNDKDVEKGDSKKENDQDEEKKDPNLITWDGDDDPENPQNWPKSKKWRITLFFSLTTLVVTFSSSVFSTATMPTSEEFGVSTEVMTLGLSLFVLGFAVGPIIWGPLSELYGRKIPLFVGFFLFAVFQIPVAVAVNLETIFLCRFFGGVFGSAPLAIVGGALGDLWDPVERGVAICLFAGATFCGPVLGPIIGSFVTSSYLGWRWTQWLTLIMAGAAGLASVTFVPETYAPLLLHQRAKRIRYETKRWAVRSEMDEQQVGMKEIITKYIFRPFQMLFTEPILFLVTLYMSVIYGILYGFFESYPIAFEEVRGWSPGLGSLPFIGIMIGVLIGCGIISWVTLTRFKRKMKEAGHVVPEERLIPMIIGGFWMPAGLFWFAWTSHPGTHWIAQALAGIPIGMGVLLIFMQGLNYIIDCYMVNANSAIAANTFFRSALGAAFPMFSLPFFHNLGVDWATSTLAFITAALFPVPILFYIYGEKIRKISKFAAH